MYRNASHLLVTALLFLTSRCLAFDADKKRTIEVTIDGAYQDSDDGLRSFQRILAVAPRRMANVKLGESLSAVLLREYRFGTSDLPRIYDAIEKEVLASNKLTSADRLRPQELLIPAIPPNSWSNPNWFNASIPFRVECGRSGLGSYAKSVPIPESRLAARRKI